jgi:hypothetical protein
VEEVAPSALSSARVHLDRSTLPQEVHLRHDDVVTIGRVLVDRCEGLLCCLVAVLRQQPTRGLGDDEEGTGDEEADDEEVKANWDTVGRGRLDFLRTLVDASTNDLSDSEEQSAWTSAQ